MKQLHGTEVEVKAEAGAGAGAGTGAEAEADAEAGAEAEAEAEAQALAARMAGSSGRTEEQHNSIAQVAAVTGLGTKMRSNLCAASKQQNPDGSSGTKNTGKRAHRYH
jgi:hypothetical protein